MCIVVYGRKVKINLELRSKVCMNTSDDLLHFMTKLKCQWGENRKREREQERERDQKKS